MPLSIAHKIEPTKKARDLARKVLAGGELSRSSLERIQKVLTDQKELDSQGFLQCMRENSNKTDDELLQDLQTVLESKTSREGRPVGTVATQRMNERVLLSWRLQQRGLTYDQIGEQLKCSNAQVGTYISRAKSILRVDPMKINLPQQIGESLNFYEDLKQMALFIASGQQSSKKDKLTAMSVALGVERDKNEFLTKVGVYSPSVVDSFKSLVLQQVTVLMGNTEKPVTPENQVDLFFSNVAAQLLDCARSDHPPLQSIAEDVEYVDAPPK